MNVGRKRSGFVQSPDADEVQRVPGTGIIAPHGDETFGASGDSLTLAAIGRGIDDNDLACQDLHTIRLDHRIQRKGRPGFPLAPTAMAAVNNQGFARHAISNLAAGATALEAALVSAG